jgi:Ca2+-binding EF-hand superfamily protein
MHVRNHIFYEIKIPTYAMNNLQPVQEISYPGRVDVSKAPNLPAELCKDLVDKSDMEKAEIEGLYEQFLCLASSKRQGDTLEYAIDRMTFPHIISPLSPYAPTRPSLVFDRLFAMFDRNRDGLVDFEEFVMGVVFLRNRAGRKDKWRKTFEAYDLDGDGYVTRADFLRMFRALFMIQKDLTLDLVSKNEAVNGLRDITPFAQSGRVISAAFNQNPREIGEARLPIAKSPNAYGDVRHQPEQDVVVENGSAEGDPDLVIGHAWESQAQFPFNNRTGEPLSLRDFLYLAPRDSLGQAPTDVARDQRVHFAFDGQPITEARMKVVEQRKDRRTFYDISEYEDSTSSFTEVNGYQIPKPAQDVGNDIAYQVMEESLNELVDPMFKAKEDLHMEAHAAADEINRWRSEIEEYAKRKKQEREAAKRAANDPLMAAAAAAERDAWLEREAKYEAAQDSPVEPEPNGHPTFPPANGRRQGAMANLVADLEGHVQARPLRELLDSEGFAVRNDQPLQQAVTTPGSTTATHVDISTTSPELAAAADNTSLPLPPSAMTPPATEPSGTLCPPQPHTASREPTGAPTLPQYRDPTMPQYKPNSQKELEELLPRDVTLDSLRSRPAISQPIDPTPEEAAAHIRLRFEANIIHQFEYMFLGWERDPDTGLVINATTQAQHEGNEEQSPSEARLERLAELKQYLVAQRKEIPPGALDYAEFESIVLGTGGSEFKFLEGWLEVCYF